MHHENRGQASLYHVQSPASFWWCWWNRLPIPIQLAGQFWSPAGRVPVTTTKIILIIFSTKKSLRRSARWWSATRWLANVSRSLVMIIMIGGDYHDGDHHHDWWSPEIIFTEVANIWMWDEVTTCQRSAWEPLHELALIGGGKHQHWGENYFLKW